MTARYQYFSSLSDARARYQQDVEAGIEPPWREWEYFYKGVWHGCSVPPHWHHGHDTFRRRITEET